MADVAVRCAMSVLESSGTGPAHKKEGTVQKYPLFEWSPQVTVDTSAFTSPPKLPTFTKDLRLLQSARRAGAPRPRPLTPAAIMPPTPMEYARAKENVNGQMRLAHQRGFATPFEQEMVLMKQEAWRLAELRQSAAQCLTRVR